MLNYKHILLALDLSAATQQILARAAELARQCSAKISIVHVMEHAPIAYGGEFSVPMDVKVELTLEKNIIDSLAEIGNKLQIAVDDQYVLHGSIKHEITQLAKNLAVDLIIVGTHGHHGLGILLGSHANAILHLAHCDVLVVRIFESN